MLCVLGSKKGGMQKLFNAASPFFFWQQLGYLYQIKPFDAHVICSANPKV